MRPLVPVAAEMLTTALSLLVAGTLGLVLAAALGAGWIWVAGGLVVSAFLALAVGRSREAAAPAATDVVGPDEPVEPARRTALRAACFGVIALVVVAGLAVVARAVGYADAGAVVAGAPVALAAQYLGGWRRAVRVEQREGLLLRHRGREIVYQRR